MNKIPTNVLKFAEQINSMDLLESFSDYSNHYKAEVLGQNKLYNKEISFSEKNKKIHEEIEVKIAELAGMKVANFSEVLYKTSPQYQWASYAVVGMLVDSILPDSVIEVFDRFAEVRVAGFGDSFAFDIKPNSLFVVTKAGNGKRHTFAQRQHNGQAVLLPENRMITVEEDVYRILAGKRNLAEYAIKIARSMQEAITEDIYNAINDTYTALPTQFKEASFTQDSFVDLTQRVSSYNGGGSVSVFGTKKALSKIVPTSDYFKMQLGDVYTRTGYLSTFMGIDLFEVPPKADWTSSTYGMKLDDTRLYVISSSEDKLVKVGIEGQTITYSDGMTANANLTQKQTMHKRWATALISNAHYGIIDIS